MMSNKQSKFPEDITEGYKKLRDRRKKNQKGKDKAAKGSQEADTEL